MKRFARADVSKPPLSPDQHVRRWIRRSKVPGMSLAVVERGRPTLTRAYGYRDSKARLPATARTIYGLASITKSFTALAILKLEEEGKLSTRDPIVRHLPEFGTPDPRASRRISIHHFLTHTSGLPSLASTQYAAARALARDPSIYSRITRRVGFDPDHAPIDTYEQLMEFLRTTRYRLLGPPGRYFNYINEGYGLLGAVIERVSGRTHESYLESEILGPAGMRSTCYDLGVLFRQPEVTTLYSPKRTGARRGLAASQDWWDAACIRACGSLRSNVEDMARYVQIFLNNGRVDGERIVSAGSIRKMTSPHVELTPGSYYGYGLSVRPDYHGTPLVFHGGADPGISAFFAAVPRRHLGGVVLANLDGVSTELALMPEINARLGLPPETQWEEVPRTIKRKVPLREYEGWYGCPGVWFEVKAVRNALWFDFHGTQGKLRGLRLLPAGHDRFVFRFGGQKDQVRFERDARGRLWALFGFGIMIRRRAPTDFRRAGRGTVVW
jgi:CubicO group peptidase (beta-lactamase class C family)